MSEQEDFYKPEQIDEQVDALLQNRDLPAQDQRMAQDMHLALANTDAGADAQSLQRVLHQLLDEEHFTHRQSREIVPSSARIQRRKYGKVINMKMSLETPKKSRPIMRVLTTLAAVLVVAVLVGSMLVFSRMAHQTGSAASPSTGTGAAHHPLASTPQGIYSSSNTAVFKLDIQNQQAVVWQQALPNVSKILPAGNVVYVLQSSQNSQSTNAALELNASNGKILWKHVFTEQNTKNVAETNNLQLDQNRLFVGWSIWLSSSKAEAQIYALNASNGSQLSVYTNPFTQALDAMSAGDGVLAMGGTRLQVYNTTTNKFLWQASMAGVSGTSVILLKVVNNLVYAVFSNSNEQASAGQSYIVAYQATTGKQVWQGPSFAGDAIYNLAVDQNTVYFGTLVTNNANQPFTGRIYAYNIQSNKQLWSTPVDGGAQEPIVVSNGTLYTAVDQGGTLKSHLIALDSATGAIKWQHLLDTVVLNSFCLSNGIIYVGRHAPTANPGVQGANASLEAFKAASGQQIWKSTQYGNSNLIPVA